MSLTHYNPRKINDNPVYQAGLFQINARQWSTQAKRRKGRLYGQISAKRREEILNDEPVWTLIDSNEGADCNASETFVRVFSSLNMLDQKGETFDAVKKRLVFVGFAMSEPTHQGMDGRQNGDVAVQAGGLRSVFHTGTDNIPAGSLVGMRAPDPRLVQQKPIDKDPAKVVGETYAYEPSVDDASRQRGFMVLASLLESNVDVSKQVAADNELQGYVEWWRTERVVSAIAIIEYMRANGQKIDNSTVVDVFKYMGLLPSKPQVADASTKLQLRILKRAFVMNSDPKSGEKYFDEKQLYFPLSMGGTHSVQKNMQEVSQLQNTAIENNINSVMAISEPKRKEVIGVAPVGALPGQPFDIILRSRMI